MKKIINGFNVEVVRASVYSDEVKSKLVFNADSEEWQVVNHVERAGVTYTINDIIEVGAEFYRPTETSGFLDHAIAKWVAEGKEHNLELSKEILEGINKEILTDFFNKADSMLPTDLQYYEGEDELTSLDKSVAHNIQLIIPDMYYYKGVYFILMPFEFTDSAKVTVKSKIIVGNESLEYTRFNAEDPSKGDCEELDNFLSSLNLEEDVVEHISHIAFVEACETSDI